MSVYDIGGNILTSAYDISGNSLTSVYDIDGNLIDGLEPEPIVEPMSWSMTDNYKGQILGALDEIKTYKITHPSAYALCQFNDVHLQFSANEPNFIDYNKGYKVIDRMLFVGDIVNNYDSVTYSEKQFTDAITYMNGASASKKMVAMGNHEYGHYSEQAVKSDVRYKPIINVPCVYPYENIVMYYHDDTENNVRYIVLNFSYELHGQDLYSFNNSQFEWFVSVLESAGSKDIVVVSHVMLNPFTMLETGAEKSWTAGGISNQSDLINCINAWENRSTYTIPNSSSTHNFSNCTGDFVMYTCGHYHALSYADFGFNMIACPTLQTPESGAHKGFIFYLIDKALKSIKVTMCSPQLTNSLSFNYTY